MNSMNPYPNPAGTDTAPAPARRPMRVGVGVATADPHDVAFVVDAEKLGADCVWVAEVWGHDALTRLAFLAARTSSIHLASGIVQIGARTPAMLAMSAMSLQHLSNGRFVLGIGTSGPQVMEGWHGVRFSSPIAATRETIDIVRMIARGDRLSYDGSVYQLPLPGSPGRPMKTMAAPVRVPIYVASLGPRNLALTGELADGWVGNAFIPETADAFLVELRRGAERSGRTVADLDLVMPVAVEFTDDFDEAARRHASGYAFTIGAMGSRDQNFYNAAFSRQGYADDIEAVQQLWLAGKREEAALRVPLDLGWKTNLLGTAAMIKERVRLYRDAGITQLQAKLSGSPQEQLDTLAQLLDVVSEVNAAA
jgi:F420-dependent oxidoreductase-like protein